MDNFKENLATKIYKYHFPERYRFCKFDSLTKAEQNLYSELANSFITCFNKNTPGINSDAIYKISEYVSGMFENEWGKHDVPNSEEYNFYNEILFLGLNSLRSKKVNSPFEYDKKVNKIEFSPSKNEDFSIEENTDEVYFNINDNRILERLEDSYNTNHNQNRTKYKEQDDCLCK